MRQNSLFSRGLSAPKGFIGPIGDDLPSLVPIVIALVLFFTVFSFTLNAYNAKNLYLSRQIEMTSVARQIKGDSLILSVDSFKDKCSSIESKAFPYNFMIGIFLASSSSNLSDIFKDFTLLSANPDYEGSALISAESEKDSRAETLFCPYKRVGAKDFTGKEKSYFVRFYPVAVQLPIGDPAANNYLIIPAVMAMVVWD